MVDTVIPVSIATLIWRESGAWKGRERDRSFTNE